MKIFFTKLELPMENAELVDIHFSIQVEPNDQSFFAGSVQASMPVKQAMDMKLSEILDQTRQTLIEKISAGAK